MRKITTFLALASAGVAWGASYTVVDLGPGVAQNISNGGQVAGWTQDLKAFRVAAGGQAPVVIGAAGLESFAYGVNSSGLVAGTSYQNGDPHGTLWGNGGVAGDFGAGSFATAINDSGQVAGGNGHAFVYAGGVMRDLGTLGGGSWSSAYGINAAGETIGYSDTAGGAFRAFFWTAESGLNPLGTLGGRNSYATSVNDHGLIAGHSTTAAGYEHAFISWGGALIDLGTLGGTSSYASDINNSGAVTGYSFVPDEPNSHAFLYDNGVLIDLNSLIPANSGWELLSALAINDAGQIAGTGLYRGQSHAFRLDPANVSVEGGVLPASIPEPGTLGLMLIGFTLAAWRTRRAARNP